MSAWQRLKSLVDISGDQRSKLGSVMMSGIQLLWWMRVRSRIMRQPQDQQPGQPKTRLVMVTCLPTERSVDFEL